MLTMPSRAQLLDGAKSFCASFSSSEPLSAILKHFSTQIAPSVHEYGLPCLAPFLGRTFKGREAVLQYFETIFELLKVEGKMSFDGWMVDTETGLVSVTGMARFRWISTGECWDETFCYRLKMVEEGEEGDFKVEEYRIWADTGAGEFDVVYSALVFSISFSHFCAKADDYQSLLLSSISSKSRKAWRDEIDRVVIAEGVIGIWVVGLPMKDTLTRAIN